VSDFVTEKLFNHLLIHGFLYFFFRLDYSGTSWYDASRWQLGGCL